VLLLLLAYVSVVQEKVENERKSLDDELRRIKDEKKKERDRVREEYERKRALLIRQEDEETGKLKLQSNQVFFNRPQEANSPIAMSPSQSRFAQQVRWSPLYSACRSFGPTFSPIPKAAQSRGTRKEGQERASSRACCCRRFDC